MGEPIAAPSASSPSPGGGVFATVVDAMRAEPAYVLVFGVAALFFIGGGAVAIIGGASGNVSLLAATLLCWVFAMLSALYAIRMRQGGRGLADRAGWTSRTRRLSDELVSALDSIAESVERSLERPNDALHGLIGEALDEWRAISSEWGAGQVMVSGVRYNAVLLRAYETAGTSVFCTTAPKFGQMAWSQPLGEQILEAHKKSRARVTRVFVFDSFAELTAEALAVMEKHASEGIEVHAYFDDEDETFEFSPVASRDFAIIDGGRLLGVTESFNPDFPSAKWYFGDENRIGYFENVKEQLLRGSEELEAVRQRWVSVAASAVQNAEPGDPSVRELDIAGSLEGLQETG